METKLTRPNLSDVTKLKFESKKDYMIWYTYEADRQAMEEFEMASHRLPELIQIAEMYFDEKKSNPDSLVFQMVSKVLNDIKP